MQRMQLMQFLQRVILKSLHYGCNDDDWYSVFLRPHIDQTSIAIFRMVMLHHSVRNPFEFHFVALLFAHCVLCHAFATVFIPRGRDGLDLTRHQVDGDDALHPAVVDQQFGDEPLVVTNDARVLEGGLEQRVQPFW